MEAGGGRRALAGDPQRRDRGHRLSQRTGTGRRKKLTAGVRLVLYHPVAASISCSECQKWFYDFRTGKRQERGGQPVPRPAKITPPCWECPKESPEQAHEHELSEKNKAAYRFAQEVRATHGQCLVGAWRTDGIVRRNLRLIQEIIDGFERYHARADIVGLAGMRVTGAARKK